MTSTRDFSSLPQKVWMYWESGEADAPLLVRLCIESWRRENPGWDIEVLDRSVWEHLPALDWLREKRNLSVQVRSDLLRLHLLNTSGGVWADATLFCNQPLTAWLPACYDDHFFAFSSIKPDREVSSWFLAGTGESRLFSAWFDAATRFWREHDFQPQGYWRRQLLRKLMSLRKRNLVSNDIWFSDFLLRRVRAYPYPAIMYLFDRILAESSELAETWARHPKMSDRDCEYLQNPLGIHSPVTAESRRFLDDGAAPLYKLNWRQDRGRIEPGSNFEYLLRLKNMR